MGDRTVAASCSMPITLVRCCLAAASKVVPLPMQGSQITSLRAV